jgi:hypothetical protein
MTRLAFIVLLALAACLIPAQVGIADAKGHGNTISLDKCPAAVRATINREAGNGSVHEVSKVRVDGVVIYCADIVKGDRMVDVDVTKAGKVIQTKAGACPDDCGDHPDTADGKHNSGNCSDDCGDTHDDDPCHDDCD